MSSNSAKKISDLRIKSLKCLIESLKINSLLLNQSYEQEINLFTIVNEALTHTSANKAVNHERLEFIGDAVLRLAASEFIGNKFPKLSVGRSSAMRSQLVSDKWLSMVGNDIGIESFIIMGAKAERDSSALETIKAESTEALIGALYEWSNSLKPIHLWLESYWNESSKTYMNDPHKYNPKSALQEWSQGSGLKLPFYKSTELSKTHGDLKRFLCEVYIDSESIGQGSGKSIKDAEKMAALNALDKIDKN